MTALKVSGNNLVRENGRLVTVTGLEEIAQKWAVSLRLVMGEWFADENAGVPWYERIFIKNPQPAEITSVLRRATLAVPGIASIESLTFDFDSTARKLSVQVKALDDDGNPIDLDRVFSPFSQDE